MRISGDIAPYNITKVTRRFRDVFIMRAMSIPEDCHVHSRHRENLKYHYRNHVFTRTRMAKYTRALYHLPASSMANY